MWRGNKKTGLATGFFYLPSGVIVQPFFIYHKLSWGTWDALPAANVNSPLPLIFLGASFIAGSNEYLRMLDIVLGGRPFQYPVGIK